MTSSAAARTGGAQYDDLGAHRIDGSLCLFALYPASFWASATPRVLASAFSDEGGLVQLPAEEQANCDSRRAVSCPRAASRSETENTALCALAPGPIITAPELRSTLPHRGYRRMCQFEDTSGEPPLRCRSGGARASLALGCRASIRLVWAQGRETGSLVYAGLPPEHTEATSQRCRPHRSLRPITPWRPCTTA